MAGVKGKPNCASDFFQVLGARMFFSAYRTKMTAAGDVVARRTAFTPE
jgi:hypothetical protein